MNNISNIGKIIKDFYCNGFAGRRYDLDSAIIEAEGTDYIILRLQTGEPVPITFTNWDHGKYVGSYSAHNKQEWIDAWVSGEC